MLVKTNKFLKLRNAHHREKAEDYVEMIQELVAQTKEARLTEVAKRFGVSAVTAHKIIARLKREKLIETKPYRAIFLTSKGKRLATQSKKRHAIVHQFLKKIGVPEKAAQIDAEGIEHHVSQETLTAFKKFLKGAACFASFLLFSQATYATDWGHSLVTDRPDTAESSVTVGRFHFQAETSFAFSHHRNNGITTHTYSFPTLFRFGLLENLEARLEGETYAFQTTTNAPEEKGFTDIAVGFKIHFFDQKEALPSLGFLAHMNIPTGKSSFSSHVAEPIFKAIADWALPKDFSLGTNIGIDIPVRDSKGDKFARFLYAASLSHPLPPLHDRWRAFVELAGATPINNDKADEHHFDLGSTFLITPNMQIDTFIQLGLNRSAPDVTTGLGWSIRIF